MVPKCPAIKLCLHGSKVFLWISPIDCYDITLVHAVYEIHLLFVIYFEKDGWDKVSILVNMQTGVINPKNMKPDYFGELSGLLVIIC